MGRQAVPGGVANALLAEDVGHFFGHFVFLIFKNLLPCLLDGIRRPRYAVVVPLSANVACCRHCLLPVRHGPALPCRARRLCSARRHAEGRGRPGLVSISSHGLGHIQYAVRVARGRKGEAGRSSSSCFPVVPPWLVPRRHTQGPRLCVYTMPQPS